MSAVRLLVVDPGEAGQRLDRWFRRHFPELGHGRLEKLLRTGQVRVDGGRVKASHRLAAGAKIRIPPLEALPARPPAPRLAVSRDDVADLQARVLYRDKDILAINKPAGLAVQGGSKTVRHLDGMLDALTFEASERPRLVHRLDRDTSGVLVLARNVRAAARLGAAFADRRAKKLYWALCAGAPTPGEGVIDAPLAKLPGARGERVRISGEGRRAVTLYRVIEEAGPVAWLALQPLTGRTHQLRVHCAALGAPIVGDGKYGGPAAFIAGLARKLHLHARAISLPLEGGRELVIRAPLDGAMAQSWQFFGFHDPAADVFLEERS